MNRGISLSDWRDLREFVVAISSYESMVCDCASERHCCDAFASIVDRSNYNLLFF